MYISIIQQIKYNTPFTQKSTYPSTQPQVIYEHYTSFSYSLQ